MTQPRGPTALRWSTARVPYAVMCAISLLVLLALTGCQLITPPPQFLPSVEDLRDRLVCDGIARTPCERMAIDALRLMSSTLSTLDSGTLDVGDIEDFDTVTITAPNAFEICWDDPAACVDGSIERDPVSPSPR